MTADGLWCFFSCVNLVRLDLFFSECSALYGSELKLANSPIGRRRKQSSSDYSWCVVCSSARGHSLPLLSSTPRPALLPDWRLFGKAAAPGPPPEPGGRPPKVMVHRSRSLQSIVPPWWLDMLGFLNWCLLLWYSRFLPGPSLSPAPPTAVQGPIPVLKPISHIPRSDWILTYLNAMSNQMKEF